MMMHVKKITDQLGFGNAASTIAVLPTDTELLAIIERTLQDPRILATVAPETTDDGCGDGRMAKADESLAPRPKVFGGGATMTVSTLIGTNRAAEPPETLFLKAIAMLRDNQVNFGAHNDEYRDACNCGCGAIDNFSQIIDAVTTYQQEIIASIKLLGVDTNGLTEVMRHFQAYSVHYSKEPYNGKVVSDAIKNEGKVVKTLLGEHIEKAIVLNVVPDCTVDQGFVHRQTGGKADVFAVDVWRIHYIAESIYSTPAEQKAAVVSQLVYTLATAAVLTRGNLPVYLINN